MKDVKIQKETTKLGGVGKCEGVDLGGVERCECKQNALGGALNKLIKTVEKKALRKVR